MSLSVKIKGVTYDRFISYRISRSVEHLSGEFDLSLTNEGYNGLPFHRGDEIVIYVNTTPILTGWIEKLDVSYSNEAHTIQISGRDKTCDIIDSTLGNKIEFKAPITLDKVIESVKNQLNLSHIKLTNNVHDLEPFEKGELVTGEITETVFDFLEKYTRKRQVLMTTDGEGGFVITRTGSEKADSSIVHISEGAWAKNNVLEAHVSYDESQRFYEYRIHSQDNPSANPTNTKTNKSVSSKLGVAHDDAIRKSRFLDLDAESTGDNTILKRRAEWEANIRKARSMTYSCTLQGHTSSSAGKPWKPNLLVQVEDQFALIISDLLIKSVEYTLDEGGTKTQLEIVSPNSYDPEPKIEKIKKHRKIGKHGHGKGRHTKTFEDYIHPGGKTKKYQDYVGGDD